MNFDFELSPADFTWQKQTPFKAKEKCEKILQQDLSQGQDSSPNSVLPIT